MNMSLNIMGLLSLQLPVPCSAAVMASTVGGAASASAAGRARSATFPPPSASILSVGDTDSAWRETVCATRATKESAVIKVIQEEKLFPLDSRQTEATHFFATLWEIDSFSQ